MNTREIREALRRAINETTNALSVRILNEEVVKALADHLTYLLQAERLALTLVAQIREPINPATREPYFTVPPEGWGTGWTAGEVTRASDPVFPDISELDRAAGKLKLRDVFGAQKEPFEPEWIEWYGGECPVKSGQDVEVRFRDGSTDRCDTPEYWRWSHKGDGADIVAYRIWPQTGPETDKPSVSA